MNQERKQSPVEMVKELTERVYRSVFRSPPIPTNEYERSQSVAANFFFHIHSSKVNESTLKFSTTLGLGLLSLYTFIILTVTGILLMFYYVPTAEHAYERMLDLRSSVFMGTFLRNLHRWSAHAMVALVFAHMVRVFLTGAHKAPREFNWVIGVILFLLTLLMSFTGYLLPWDQLAYWAIVVGSSIATYAPLVGDEMKYILLGADQVGGEAVLRFYVLHVAVLPAVLVTFIGVHFWRIRKDGGLATPSVEDEPVKAATEIPAKALGEDESASAQVESPASPEGATARSSSETSEESGEAPTEEEKGGAK